MDRFRESVDAVRRGEEPPEDGYRGEYVAATRRRAGRPRRGDARADRGVARALPHPLRLVGEPERRSSSTSPELLPKLDTYEAEGTLWARTSAHGDDKDRPLVRAVDGSYLYFAADVAYLADKFARGFDIAIYVLGADHHGYVARLKAAAAMLGFDPARVEVLIYQLVHLTKGGEQTKMSKRRGDVVFLDDFMDEIGVDAARWYLVNRGPDQTIDVDIDLAAEKSQKNPVYYVQYAHARIAGILRNAGAARGVGGARRAARAGGARAREAAGGVPGGRRRGGRAARAAGDPDVRDPRRGRLPPLLPRASRARVRAAGVPARALPRHADT